MGGIRDRNLRLNKSNLTVVMIKKRMLNLESVRCVFICVYIYVFDIYVCIYAKTIHMYI
jgi:hypothetical protein